MVFNACGAREGLLLLVALGSQIGYQVAMAFIHRVTTAFLCKYFETYFLHASHLNVKCVYMYCRPAVKLLKASTWVKN